MKNSLAAFIFFSLVFQAQAQELPLIKALRAEENYASLLKNDTLRNNSFMNQLKAIPLYKSRSIYLSIGGEYRPRWEHTNNKNWSAKDKADESFYAQRIMMHTDLHVGKFIRFFGQLTHGLLSLKDPVYAQSDMLDLHQAFVEFTIPFKKAGLRLRAGRQELLLGSGRLMAFRDGPNSRRSFDMARIIIDGKDYNRWQRL